MINYVLKSCFACVQIPFPSDIVVIVSILSDRRLLRHQFTHLFQRAPKTNLVVHSTFETHHRHKLPSYRFMVATSGTHGILDNNSVKDGPTPPWRHKRTWPLPPKHSSSSICERERERERERARKKRKSAKRIRCVPVKRKE
jgi:hypothetical protein